MRKNYSGNVFSPMGCRSFLCPWKDKEGIYKFEGRFNQGVVSINLPQVAIAVDNNETKFWQELEERLKLCFEALMCKHYALLGTIADISPIHFRNGAIARLESGERIDDLLKGGYSTLSLGYIGLYETTKMIIGSSMVTKEGKEFAIKLMKKLKETVDSWKKETGLGFVLYGTPIDSVGRRFARIDREYYGTVNEKGYYTNSFHFDKNEEIDEMQRLKIESEFQNLSLGGSIIYFDVANKAEDEVEDLIKYIYENVQYVELSDGK